VRETREPCERIGEYISRQLDGDLAELELIVLRRHLASCAGCRVFADAVAGQTTALRMAPLEATPRPFDVPRVRRMRLLPASAAAAAAFAVAVGIGGVLPQLRAARARPASSLAAPITLEQKEIDFKRAQASAAAARIAAETSPVHRPDAYGRPQTP
jgi:hypothetical protein